MSYIVQQRTISRTVVFTFVNLILKGQQRQMVFRLNQTYTVYDDSKRASKIFLLLVYY
jgi:hypothetical protein